MVNESVELSLSNLGCSNVDDSFYRKSCNVKKSIISESSDEDTTSSSLLPLPDNLNEIRKELKTTINNICGETTEFDVSLKEDEKQLDDVSFNKKFSNDKEISIVKKITSANFLFDNVFGSSSLSSGRLHDVNPLVFNPKATFCKRENLRENESLLADQCAESSSVSSADRCPSIAVAPFVISNPYWEHTRCHCEKTETMDHQNNEYMYNHAEKIPQNDMCTSKNQEKRTLKKRNFLTEKMHTMRMRCRKRKISKNRKFVDEALQTENSIQNFCSYSHTCEGKQGIPRYNGQCEFLNTEMKVNRCLSDKLRLHSCGKYGCQVDLFPMCQMESVGIYSPMVPKPSFKEHNNHEGRLQECYCPMDAVIKDPNIRQIDLVKSEDPKIIENHEEFKAREEEVSPAEREKSKERQLTVPVSKEKNPKNQEKIDIYYFDHGNSAYYRTTDSHPAKYTEYLIEKTDHYTMKFWAEIFGTLTIVISFIVSFILQLYRCLFTAIIRSLLIGLIQISSDYFFKPLLTIIFNGVIQPFLILGYNIATSLRDFCVPICEICEFFTKDLAILFRSCRLIEINRKACSSPTCPCRHNVKLV